MHLYEEKKKSPSMFDTIARRYDLGNKVLSFGLDKYWRQKAAKLCQKANPQILLDLATGTGDQLVALKKFSSTSQIFYGIDPSLEMLKLAQKKVAFAHFIHGLSTHIALANEQVDACTISFGVRNFSELEASLREIHRVLKVGGQLVILEFSIPAQPLLRALYYFHLKHIMPKIAALFTGKQAAYKYLNETIRDFPSGQAFAQVLAQSGFSQVQIKPLTFGAVSIYYARKPL